MEEVAGGHDQSVDHENFTLLVTERFSRKTSNNENFGQKWGAGKSGLEGRGGEGPLLWQIFGNLVNCTNGTEVWRPKHPHRQTVNEFRVSWPSMLQREEAVTPQQNTKIKSLKISPSHPRPSTS